MKQPVLIPLAVGLLGADGNDLPLHLLGDDTPESGMCVKCERSLKTKQLATGLNKRLHLVLSLGHSALLIPEATVSVLPADVNQPLQAAL